MKRVFLISPRSSVVSAFRSQGLQTIRIVDAAEVAHSGDRESVAKIVVDDITNPLVVADAIASYGVSFGESAVLCVGLGDITSRTASAVNTMMGIGQDKFADIASLMLMSNKPRLRKRLAETLPSYTGAFTVIHDLDTLKAFFAETSSGIVVKPISGSGSRDVSRIKTCADLDAVASDLTMPILAEELFVGSEFSVEVLTINGVHQPLAVTEKILGGESGLVEMGQIQPARISTTIRELLFEVTCQLLNGVRFRYGLSHTEIILQDGVPKIVETHGRVGGDRIADLLRYTSGHNAFERLAYAIRTDSFLPARPTGARASINYYDLRDYEGSDQEWLSAALDSPRVIEATVLKTAAERGPIRCSADRHAFVIQRLGDERYS